MRYVYFTKTLQTLDLPGTIGFLKEAGLDGADLTVRPGYPVTPDNVAAELPKAAKLFQDAGLVIGLVTGPTNLNDPANATAKSLFEACGKAGVPAIKIGYFNYKDKFDASLADARTRLAGFAKLAAATGVRACYHTHSGNYLGNNAAGLRLLLQDFDAHHIGAFLDTGHTAINGGPFRMEVDLVRPWLSLVAIKDMLWRKDKDAWQPHVVPVADGIVRWNDVAAALKDAKFNGTISLHGEYETKDLPERKRLAKQELEALKKRLA
jgi:sugar phosphate isomerase/epimerase